MHIEEKMTHGGLYWECGLIEPIAAVVYDNFQVEIPSSLHTT